MESRTRNSLLTFLALATIVGMFGIPRFKGVAELTPKRLKDLTVENFNVPWQRHYVGKGEKLRDYYFGENLPNYSASNQEMYKTQVQKHPNNKGIDVDHLEYGDYVTIPELDGDGNTGPKPDSTGR